MTNWTEGYVSEIDYTHGFYRELTPAYLRFCLLAKGIQPPETRGVFSYCELGFGQGVTANMVAAAHPRAEVWGTDFNPNHAAGARRLSQEGGTTNTHFNDDSFEEFLARDDLPAFDLIVLHGIYSWVNANNRDTLARFLRRRLKVGGAVYISYNALPGWASAMPLREVMIQYVGDDPGPLSERVDRALAFAKTLAQSGAAYFTANPGVGPRLEKMEGLSRTYLAHEYFNRDWTPLYHADVVRDLDAAKLTFAASANVTDLIDVVALPPQAREMMAGIKDPVLRETLRDYALNQQFRKDIFVRGMTRLSPFEQAELLMAQRVALTVPRETIPAKARFPIGETDLKAEIYGPLGDRLAKGPTTLGDLAVDPAFRALPFPALLQAVLVMTAQGWAAPCPEAGGDGERRKAARQFNAAILNRARNSADLAYLVSPILGGGLPINRFHQLFLLARAEKHPDPAAFVWTVLAAQGQRLVKDGKTLENEEENLAELRERLTIFSERHLPLYETLGIA